MFIEQKGRALKLADRIDPATTALVVIDVQNDFCDPAGVFGSAGNDVSMMPAMAEHTCALVDAARERRMLIFWVRATYDEPVTSAPLAETYNRRGFTKSMCLEGSWGADWYANVRPRAEPNEPILTKHRFSAFWDTPLDLYLRSNGIRTVVLTGVVTSGCVESTARDAFFNDYYVVVAADAVAEASEERHTYALRKLGQAFGEVIPAQAAIDCWRTSKTKVVSWDPKRKEARVPKDLDARISPEQTALLIIDVQRDFCDPTGAIAQRGEYLSHIQQALPVMRRLMRAARAAGVRVIHVRAEYGDVDASDVSISSGAGVGATACCVPGSPGVDFVAGFEPSDGEAVIVKHRFSAFVNTSLSMLLRASGIRSLVVIGVATQCCVESTVRDACLNDFYVTIASDAVAARDRMRHLHDASLETMALYFAKVVPSAEIESSWERVSIATAVE
jgi:nicotinamidase-related amidase